MQRNLLYSLVFHIVVLLFFVTLDYFVPTITPKQSIKITTVQEAPNVAPVNKKPVSELTKIERKLQSKDYNKIEKKLKKENAKVLDDILNKDFKKKIKPIVNKPTVKANEKQSVKSTDIHNNISKSPKVKDSKVATTSPKVASKSPKVQEIQVPTVLPKQLTPQNNVTEPINVENKPKPTPTVENNVKTAEKMNVVIEAVAPHSPPKPKIIKDSNFKNLLSNLSEKTDFSLPDSKPVNILENNDILSASEKKALANQLSSCWSSISSVREEDIQIELQLEMNDDRSIKNISISEKKELNSDEVQLLSKRIVAAFKKPQCMTLNLPVAKYDKWRKFAVKVNIKGFFQ